ncbi:MAG: 50S ribosomal protein L29 [Chloroflexi bacterium]|nr:50S ribosomal protein L29 [Chloroflexota bacterium]
MKAAEIRGNMSAAEIRQEIDNHYQELFNLRFQMAAKQLVNTNRVRQVKRNIARLNTILREYELFAEEVEA